MLLQGSVMDIVHVEFDSSGKVKKRSYMEMFPFPFYIILRDINNLPTILGDALRQWFEIITAGDHWTGSSTANMEEHKHLAWELKLNSLPTDDDAEEEAYDEDLLLIKASK